MARASKSQRKRDRGLRFWSISGIVCATTIIMLAPLVPAVGPYQREAYFLVCCVTLVVMGWLLGASGTDKI